MNETIEATALAASTSSTSITGNIIWLYALVIALLILIPHVLDIVKAYRAQNKIREQLINKCAKDGISPEELKELLKEARKSPPGIAGLTRGAIAFTVIVILGIALFHMIITRTAEDSQIIGNILSMVGSLIAAIVGFYFGGRTKDKAAEEATEEATEKTKKVVEEATRSIAKEATDNAKKVVEDAARNIAEEAVRKAGTVAEETAKKIVKENKEK